MAAEAAKTACDPPDTPPARQSIRRRGRSPGSRISAFGRLPSALAPVTSGPETHRLQLRGQLRIGRERRTGFPLSFGSLRRPRRASTYLAGLWRQAARHRPSNGLWTAAAAPFGQRRGLPHKVNDTCNRIRLPAAVHPRDNAAGTEWRNPASVGSATSWIEVTIICGARPARPRRAPGRSPSSRASRCRPRRSTPSSSATSSAASSLPTAQEMAALRALPEIAALLDG